MFPNSLIPFNVGIVINNERLMEEVERMVKESKEEIDESNIQNSPFLIEGE